ncbi:hypothetical protein MC885_010963 [Smutsia gigantea]|nr:hypothetical protein MC885_010963 [Smutsia gigantea]
MTRELIMKPISAQHKYALSPPAPSRRARPTPPSAPPDGSGWPAFPSSASERQLHARAPEPRSPAGGRQKLRRRRRPRGQAPARLASRGPKARGLGSRHQRTPAGCPRRPSPATRLCLTPFPSQCWLVSWGRRDWEKETQRMEVSEAVSSSPPSLPPQGERWG